MVHSGIEGNFFLHDKKKYMKRNELTSFVGIFYGMNFIIGHGAQHFDENVFVGSDASHGIVQFLHIKVDDWCQ